MRSGLSESEAGHATWEDVSKDTFVQFAQFAYTGDYSVPILLMPEAVPDSVSEASGEGDFLPVDETEQPEMEWGSSGGWGKNKKKKRPIETSKTSILRAIEGFPSTPPPLLTSRNNYEGTCDPASEFDPLMNYAGLFTTHASLWILGDYRNIGSLKALALYKLHKTLSVFQLNSENVQAIVDLVRNAYSEEGAGLGEGISGLRKMVCQYLGPNKALLCDDDGFMDLLGEGGQFVKDFFKYSSA